MRVLLFFAILFYLAPVIPAQNGYSVSGTVTNAAGPVEGADVTLTPPGSSAPAYATKTDADGRYRFHASPGKYLLSATKLTTVGSENSLPLEVEARIGDVVRRDLVLAPAGIRESVTISADQPQHETATAADAHIGGGRTPDIVERAGRPGIGDGPVRAVPVQDEAAQSDRPDIAGRCSPQTADIGACRWQGHGGPGGSVPEQERIPDAGCPGLCRRGAPADLCRRVRLIF